MDSIKLNRASSDKIFYTIVNFLLLTALIIVTIPIVHIISSSLSDPRAVSTGKVFLWPVDFSLRGYQAVFQYKAVLTGYANTGFYAIVGTLVNLVMTFLAAYPLSRKKLPFRKSLIALFTFTMIFSGGMIPTYMLNVNLGMIDNRLVMFIPTAISVFNLTIAKNFFQNNIPEELFEASQIDGCDYFRYIYNVVLPLSKPIFAVLALYYAIVHWNSFFDAFLYLTSPGKLPLSVVLRDILVLNSITAESLVDATELLAKQGMSDLLKYALIIVASLPLIIVYPFISKHFAKGALIGAVKG